MARSREIRGLGPLQKLGLALSISFCAVTSVAQMVEVKLPTLPAKVSSPNLRKMKALENDGKNADCARLGLTLFESQPAIRGWLLRSWLKCAFNADREEKKVGHLSAALSAFDRFNEKHPGPWADDNRQTMIQSRLWLLESFLRTNLKLGDQHLTPVMNELRPRETEFQARAWALLGEQAQLRHDLAGAEVAYQQSLNYADGPATAERLKTVRLALNKVDVVVPAMTVTQETPSEIEARFTARFKASKEKNDQLQQLEDALAYLNELPNGLQAKTAAASCLEIHQTLLNRSFEGNNRDRWRSLLQRAAGVMDDADPERLVEWAPILFRRGDYAGSLQLSEVIIDRYAKTATGDEVLWSAARSAQLTGQYKKAEKYYSMFFERHGGSELARDAEFQWALTLIRSGDYASAVARLEKLLRASDSEKYELSARYWLVRSLQALGNNRASDEIKIVVAKFPSSYYGIRLRAETQNNQFTWPFPEEKLKGLKGSLRLSPRQKQAWDRLVILRSHGWTSEALSETDELPLPEDATMKVLWAQELVKAEAFPKVIKLVNEVSDLSQELRSVDVLRLGFPAAYEAEIAAAGQARSLNPVLIRSLIRQESAFNSRAVSRSNALGLMQLIPGTAREVGDALKLGPLAIPEDVFRIGTNVQMGSAYLARMIRYFSGSVPLGLAAYNAGPRRMEAFLEARLEMKTQLKTASSHPMTEVWFDELPWSETSFYVKAILRNSLLYKTLEQQKIQLDDVLWRDLAVQAAP
jgi:soluble lytic murein transglycosylase